MKHDIIVRQSRLSDLEKIHKMAKDEMDAYNWFNKAALRKNLLEEPKLCFSLESQNEVKGVIFFRQEWGTVVWNWLIFIDKDIRHKGIGAEFEEMVRKNLHKAGFRIMYSEVDESNKHMLRWCRKNNYRRICKFPDWFGINKHAIIFRKDI